MSNVDINVDRRRRTDGRKIGRLYRTLLQAGAIKMSSFIGTTALSNDVSYVIREAVYV